LKTANGGTGKIYIEVPCFDWICEHRAWFDIFYEHVNYFRLTDFKRMFGEVVESGKIFCGQYLYVIAELSSLRIPVIDMNNRVNFPSDFYNNLAEQSRAEQSRAEQSRAEQSRAEQSRAEQSRAEQPFGAVHPKASYSPCSKSVLGNLSTQLSISTRQSRANSYRAPDYKSNRRRKALLTCKADRPSMS
jgi:hypothetical protein